MSATVINVYHGQNHYVLGAWSKTHDYIESSFVLHPQSNKWTMRHFNETKWSHFCRKEQIIDPKFGCFVWFNVKEISRIFKLFGSIFFFFGIAENALVYYINYPQNHLLYLDQFNSAKLLILSKMLIDYFKNKIICFFKKRKKKHFS